MKRELEELLENKSPININEIYVLFNNQSDDILIIKYDGVREINKYNVIIIGKNSRFEMINFEIESLQVGLRNALKEYLQFI